jgi:electron transfer flavoprotein beta subunit
VLACVKPTPLGEPAVARGQLVVEGQTWGLAAGERCVLAAAQQAGRALGAEVMALSAGPAAAQAGLREALALGARRAVLVAGGGRLDAALASKALALAARRLGQPALVLTGTESADAQQGLVGPMLAELLGLELLAGVERLQAEPGALVARRAAGAEEERVRATPPLLLTVSPRFQPSAHPTAWGVGEAYALPLDVWQLAELSPGAVPATELAGLARAETPRGEAERFEGDADEAAQQLARRLRASGMVA